MDGGRVLTYEPEERERAERTADACERHAAVFLVESPGGIPCFRAFEMAIPPQHNDDIEAGADWHFLRSVPCI